MIGSFINFGLLESEIRCFVSLFIQPPKEDDTDSAYGDGASSTASLSSSILQYRTIQGRRYHSEVGNAVYWYVCCGASDDLCRRAKSIRGSNDDGHNESLDIL